MKYVADIGNGATPRRNEPIYWQNGTFAWLNSSVVNSDKATKPSDLVTEEALEECHLPWISPPAVLVGITGQGRTRGMATLLAFEATINQHLAYIKPIHDVADALYLKYVVDVAYSFLRSESDGAGSTKGAITCEQLGSIKVPIPPAEEQAEISAYAETRNLKYQELATKLKTSLALLSEYRAAIISSNTNGHAEEVS